MALFSIVHFHLISYVRVRRLPYYILLKVAFFSLSCALCFVSAFALGLLGCWHWLGFREGWRDGVVWWSGVLRDYEHSYHDMAFLMSTRA